MSFRKVELKKPYAFIAVKDKSLRTLRVKGDNEAEAESKIKQKYPDWLVSPYPPR